MHGVERPMTKTAGLPPYAALILTLLAVLAAPGAARAQWATDAGDNIHNTNTGNVGVGTGSTAPAGRLEVRQIGNTGLYATILTSFGASEDTFIRGGSASAAIHIGDLTATTSKLLLMENGGFVGIGTTNPGRLLEVVAASTETRPHWASAATVSIKNTDTTTASNTADLTFRTNDAGGTTATVAKVVGVFTSHATGAVSGDIALVTTNAGTGSEKMRVTASGNVGIGTTLPIRPLHVDLGSATGQGVRIGRAAATNNPYFDFMLDTSGTPYAYISAGDNVAYRNIALAPFGANVGVGTAAPAYKLDVAGSVNSTGLCIAGDCKTAWSQVGGGSGQWTTSGTNIYFNTGNVGVGTTSPQNPLTVARAGSAPYTSRPAYELLQLVDRTDNMPEILFGSAYNGMWLRYTGTDGTATNQRLGVVTGGAGEAFVINNDGKVGIGTTSPGARLHVIGANGPLDNTATPAPTAFTVTGGTGGNGNWGASPGGAGGDISLTGGTGGVPVAGSNSATGGTGGAVTITGGTGGTSAFTTSGTGGSVIINGGAAGASSPTGAAGSVILANLRGNVGVGTATPAYKLDVAGSVNGTGLCLAGDCKTAWSQVGGGTASNVGAVNVSSGQFGANVGGGNFSFPASVGIGTASPGASLDIGGNPASALRTSYLNFSSNNTGAADRPYFRGTTSHLVINGYGTNTGGTLYLNFPGDLAAGQTTNTRVQETLFVSPTGSAGGGSVGIGTASPAERLHVSGGNVWGDSANAMLMLGPGREVSLQRDPRTGAGTSGWLESNAYLDGAGNWQLRNTGAGGVLAGFRPTTFDVWTSPAGASPAWVQQFFVTNTTGYFAGSVGIGNTSPAYKLDVAGSVNSTGLCLAGDCKTAWSQVGGGSSQWTTSGTNIYFNTGNVGIGTQTPTHTLEVAGTINASGAITGGTISATYQDVAEWVPSSQKLPAGTVVVLDAEHVNHVLASTTSYDTSVAGVVSARPGITLGEGGEGKLLVATTGRVRVKVDATRAPIKVGDLLVTSDREGVAMKSEPVVVAGRKIHAPGTIIGKALEPLAGGAGEILVLLSLQ
jgi:hypothetical protein